jgi:hypothetical protein
MNAMVLCPGCKRHVFAGETACPFCGVGFASTNPVVAPSVGPELSRAQRYVVGAAMAVSVAAVGCSSPTVVRNPDEVSNVTVDVNKTQSDHKSNQVLEVARDPNPTENHVVAVDDEAARQQREEAARRQREEELIKRKEEEQRRLQQLEDQELLRGNRWHRSCSNGVCPPYGCVFPDEACDVVRV